MHGEGGGTFSVLVDGWLVLPCLIDFLLEGTVDAVPNGHVGVDRDSDYDVRYSVMATANAVATLQDEVANGEERADAHLAAFFAVAWVDEADPPHPRLLLDTPFARHVNGGPNLASYTVEACRAWEEERLWLEVDVVSTARKGEVGAVTLA